jgi:hypothetical protein
LGEAKIEKKGGKERKEEEEEKKTIVERFVAQIGLHTHTH